MLLLRCRLSLSLPACLYLFPKQRLWAPSRHPPSRTSGQVCRCSPDPEADKLMLGSVPMKDGAHASCSSFISPPILPHAPGPSCSRARPGSQPRDSLVIRQTFWYERVRSDKDFVRPAAVLPIPPAPPLALLLKLCISAMLLRACRPLPLIWQIPARSCCCRLSFIVTV